MLVCIVDLLLVPRPNPFYTTAEGSRHTQHTKEQKGQWVALELIRPSAYVHPKAPEDYSSKNEQIASEGLYRQARARRSTHLWKPVRRLTRPTSVELKDTKESDFSEPCPPDSDDNTNCLDEVSSPASEDDEDFAYETLVESITNLVFESSCVGNVEERGVPVKLYVHSLLEQILSHQKPATESQAVPLPIRSLSKQINEVPSDTSGPYMRTRGQGDQGSHAGDASSGGTNKRKKEELSSLGNYRGLEDDEDHGYSSSEDQSTHIQHSKKQKTGKKSRNYSCPFRKRNPTRFNVREHSSCALSSFQDISLLK